MLRALRVRAGMPSVRWVGEQALVSHTTVSLAFRDHVTSWAHLAAIVDALGGDIAEFEAPYRAIEDAKRQAMIERRKVNPEGLHEHWRVGRYGRTIHRFGPGDPTLRDMIGVMDTPELAKLVVRAVNNGKYPLLATAPPDDSVEECGQ